MWFKVDDQLHSHPKVRQVGPMSVGIWVMCGSYSAAYKLDGFVPDSFVQGFGRDGRAGAKKLVASGLWERVDDGDRVGYMFHDWAHYQPLSDEIEDKRQAARERQRRSRQARAGAAKPPAAALVTPDVTGSVTRDKRVTERVSHGPPTRPDPTVEAKASTTALPARAKKHPIPASWEPNGKHRERAQQLGIDVEFEAETFRNHAEANDRAQASWDAAFSNWLLKSPRRAGGPGGSVVKSPQQRERDRQAGLWLMRSTGDDWPRQEQIALGSGGGL